MVASNTWTSEPHSSGGTASKIPWSTEQVNFELWQNLALIVGKTLKPISEAASKNVLLFCRFGCSHFNPASKNPPEVGYALTKPKPGGCRFHQVLRCLQWRNKSLPPNMIQMEISRSFCLGEARVANQHPFNCIMKLEWYQVMLPTLPQAVSPYLGCFDVAIKWIPNLTKKKQSVSKFSVSHCGKNPAA